MATLHFLGTRYRSLKDDGTINASGTIEFFEPGTSTPKTTYSNSALTSANLAIITLDAAGAADIWFDGDADVTIKDSLGGGVDTFPNINSGGTINMYLISTNTTLDATHDGGTVEASGTITLTLTDAAALTSGWNVTVRNTDTGVITIARATGSDTIDDTASNITIDTKKAETYQVNSAANGFYTIRDADEVSSVLTNDGQLVSAAVLGAGLVGWVPAGYFSGIGLVPDTGNISDTNITDLRLGVGECADSTDTYILKNTAILTKQIDATWAGGDDAGGMFTGSVAADTTYYVYLIRKDSDGSIDAGFDTSTTAANIPTGYTAYRRIGTVVTDGSSFIMNIYYRVSALTMRGSFIGSLHDTTHSDAEGQTYTGGGNSGRLCEFYTIGDQVFFEGLLSISSKGTLTGSDSAYLGNLPYVSSGLTDGSMTIHFASGITATALSGSVTTADYVLLRQWSTSGAANLTITNFTGAIYFSGSYRATVS